MSTQSPEPENTQDQAPSLWQTAGSVLASFFGVQSRRNRERDFTHGKASHFIIMGLILTVGFIATIALVVKLVLKQAGV